MRHLSPDVAELLCAALDHREVKIAVRKRMSLALPYLQAAYAEAIAAS